jgi:hypothetical protein
MIPQCRDAPRRWKARDIVAFLDRHGHAEQGGGPIGGLIQSASALSRRLKIFDNHRINLQVESFNTRNVMIEQFEASKLPSAHQVG